MSTRFTRPAGTYDSTSVTTNMTKYRTDSAAAPKVAISSAKIDGDFNKVIDALNALDDDITGLVAGSVPDGSITAAKLASNAVTTAKILDANVTTAKLAAGAVDATILATDAVTSDKILAANVTETKLANASVTGNKLGAGAVTEGKIADLAVTTAKIADAGVTYAKIQDVSAASRLLGRGSADGSGDVQEISLGTGLSLSGTTLSSSIEKFVSSNQTVPAAAGLLTVAHGLSGKPDLVQLWAEAVNTSAGYSPGDQVIVCDAFTAGVNSLGPQIYIDDTSNVEIRMAANFGLTVYNKTTGAAVVVTTTDWRFIVKAWKF